MRFLFFRNEMMPVYQRIEKNENIDGRNISFRKIR